MDEIESGKPVIDARWIFKKKYEVNDKIRFKSRLVTRGFKDINEYDGTETYALVARISDVKFLLSVANKFDLDLYQMDIKIVFLNDKLEKSVFMHILEGYFLLVIILVVNRKVSQLMIGS